MARAQKFRINKTTQILQRFRYKCNLLSHLRVELVTLCRSRGSLDVLQESKHESLSLCRLLCFVRASARSNKGEDKMKVKVLLVACAIGLTSIYSVSSEARTRASRSRSGRGGIDRAAMALQAPLVLGASVSSGLLSESPGDRAARRFANGRATNIARAGSLGREYWNISPDNIRGHTSVIGVDFLFWDSTGGDTRASLASLRNLIGSARAAGVPVGLVLVPRLSDSNPAQATLNRAIHSMCRPSRGCHVIPLARLAYQAQTTGIVIGIYLYHMQDLTVDGLHLNDVGSAYVSSMIISALRH